MRELLWADRMTEKEIKHAEFWVNSYYDVKSSEKINAAGCRIQVNHKWNFGFVEKELAEYSDKRVLDFFKFGWPLNAKNTEVNTNIPCNQAGARSNLVEVRKYLKKERESGSVIGPFRKNPFGKHARFSPLDTRPKKDSPELRIILNLSYPFESGSVNESISKETFLNEPMDLKYPTPNHLARIVLKKGKNSLIFKCDIRKCYQQFYMDLGSIAALGYVVEDQIYFDVTLSMGSRSSAYCCQRTTNSITYIYKKQGFDDVNYLDDLGAAEERKNAQKAFEVLGEILSNIGIKQSKDKVQELSPIAIFLGILYNTISMTMEIMPQRLMEIKQMVTDWLNKEQASLKDIQRLLGKLNFACSTVWAG